MLKIIVITLFFSLIGCTTNPYGNFTEKENINDVIRKDVLAKLNELHPPAKTEFTMVHNVKPKDSFGVALLAEMRTKGYGIQEYSKELEPSGDLFGYTLDQIDAIYRITIYVNEQRLSRPYLIESDSIIPSGSWSLQE